MHVVISRESWSDDEDEVVALVEDDEDEVSFRLLDAHN